MPKNGRPQVPSLKDPPGGLDRLRLPRANGAPYATQPLLGSEVMEVPIGTQIIQSSWWLGMTILVLKPVTWGTHFEETSIVCIGIFQDSSLENMG
jgi:hypothetical protein